jgi:hypothetical protein
MEKLALVLILAIPIWSIAFTLVNILVQLKKK